MPVSITKFTIGSEATRPTNPLYQHDWNDLEMDSTDVVSTDFSTTIIREEGDHYKVYECGTGDEPYRHTKTGKGASPPC